MPRNLLSTAGAVPVKNKKGDVMMEKVKVDRYIAGRKPKYAGEHSSDDSDDGIEELVQSKNQNDRYRIQQKGVVGRSEIIFQNNITDSKRPAAHATSNDEESQPTISIPVEMQQLNRRFQRLQQFKESERSRKIHDPEIIEPGNVERHPTRRRHVSESEPEEGKSDEDSDEDVVARRHAALRQNRELDADQQLAAAARGFIDDDADASDEESEDESDEESEEEEDDDEFQDGDGRGPRLKPVFVRKEDRISINRQREEEEHKAKEAEEKEKKMAEERRKAALKMVEQTVRMEDRQQDEADVTFESIEAVKTDDEDPDVAYLNWKIRELNRYKRDKNEREEIQKQKEEVERLRNMTEEERLEELRRNPKVIVNSAPKGKYKFMQKYYHRGAFFMDKEEEVLKRDTAQPTLEDHFDKSVLPSVMQVKNFGRAGRTKYTHLVDQDTTKFDSPWAMDTAQTTKFYQKHAAGIKQDFERPTKKRRF